MKRGCLVLLLMLAAVVAVAQPCRRALVFGLGEQLDKKWGKINGDKDVDYAVDMLRSMGYTDIVTLKNEQATKAAMVEAFACLAERCREGDIVYVHYSGHGQLMTDLDGDESFKWSGKHSQWDESWIPYDAYMMYGPDDKGEKHLSDDEIAVCLSAIRGSIGADGELVVAVDACHSGDATCGDRDVPVRGIGVKFSMPMDNSIPIREPIGEQWLTISACKPFQLNMEMPDPQVGKLTYALYLMGKRAFEMDNEALQIELEDFMKKHKGYLPQVPMVTGVRKMTGK